jgi:L-ascorbate metabolism protein UlaG (beta-lactamase superfamily)
VIVSRPAAALVFNGSRLHVWTAIRTLGMLLLILGAACRATGPRPAETIPADDTDVTIVPITHATLQVRHGGDVIDVDPVSGVDYGSLPPATIVLVTDIHDDHFDTRGIGAVMGPHAQVIGPAVIPSPPRTVLMANGDKKKVGAVSIEAVPMYNVGGVTYHIKGRGNGYVIGIGGKRLYIAGDTACTPEMRALAHIDVAFIPMNLPYTMSPADAADCVKSFKPAIVFPYHYSGSSPQEFVDATAGSGVEVRLRNWYGR